MKTTPTLRRWLSFGASAVVIALVLAIGACQQRTPDVTVNADEKDKKEVKNEDGKKDDSKDARSWPVWGGTVQRNLVNLVEKNMPTDWDASNDKNVLWSEYLGSKAYGGPIFSGGKIFIGTNNNRPRNKEIKGDKGILMCFRESDGKFLWQVAHDKLTGGRVNDWPEEGICSGPVVEGDRLYYVNNRSEVICASTEDGKPHWKLDMMKDLGTFTHNLSTCSPLIVGDVLYLITSNGVDEDHLRVPSPNAPSFLALSKKDGKVLWSSNLPGKNILHGQWSNPVYANVKGQPQIIFPGGDGWIYSFNPHSKNKDGELLWKFDCNPKGAKYRLGPTGTRNDFVSTPVIADNKLYIGVGQDPEHKKGVGWLWCIDITKKPANKDKDLSPYSDPKVEVPKGFDPKDPKNKESGLVWAYGGNTPEDAEREYYFGRSLSTCAVHDGLLFTADFDGYFYCFDAKTGKKHWEFNTGADTWSSPYVVDGKVYFGNENGAMHVFEASSKQKLVKKVQMKGRIRVTPVAVNGVLYVMTENPTKIWAIKAK